MKRKPDFDCKECGLYRVCKSPLMEGTGSSAPVFLFVGDYPGEVEDKSNEQFVGKVGKLLRTLTSDVGIPESTIRFSNAVRCCPPHNDLSKHKNAWKHCQPKILREIHAVNPKVVVIFGAVALKSILGRNGISKLHGEVFTDEIHNRHYVVSVHPSYLARNLTDGWITKFKAALEKAAILGGVRKKKGKSTIKVHYDYIRDKKHLYEMTDFLRSQKTLATDIESSTLSPLHPGARSGCVSWSWEDGHAIVYPIYGRVGMESKIKVHPKEMIEAWKSIWMDKSIEHSLHFGKHDEAYSRVMHNFHIANYKHDTGLASYADNFKQGIHGLDDWEYKLGGTCEMYHRLKQYQRDNPISDPSQGGDMLLVPGKILYDYNAEDSDWTGRIQRYLIPRLKERGRYLNPYRFPIMYHNQTAEAMEISGLQIDLEQNGKLLDEVPVKIKEFEDEIRSYPEYHRLERVVKLKLMEKAFLRAGSYKKPPENLREKVMELYRNSVEKARKSEKGLVNLNAAEMKKTLIYDILKLVPEDQIIRTKKSNAPSTQAKVLENILLQAKSKAPIVKSLIRRAEYSSGNSKYVVPIRGWVGVDGRTHSSYKIHGQDTGRVSSEKPNHENLIKRGDKWLVEGIQKQFIPRNSDYVLGKADLKQNELRLIADRANDKVMIKEFVQEKDPHAMGAVSGFEGAVVHWEGKKFFFEGEEGYRKLPEKLQKHLRTFAKSAVSFGLVYGRHAKALAKDMKWSLRRAQKFIDKYFGKYYGIWNYIQNTREELKESGVAISHYNRHRELEGIFDSDDFGMVERLLRQGVNAPIQGDSSDTAWGAGYRIVKYLRKHKLKTRLVIIEHDALYLDIYLPELKRILPVWEKFMTDRKWIEKRCGWYCKVPLAIDVALGRNMAELNGGKYELKKKEGVWQIPEEFQASAA